MKDNNNLHFKDCTPEETIAKIQSILNENEIEVEEIWKKHDDTINTYSTRLVYKGTSIGTNGKGVSEVYARASAYAEFMERYQNGILTNYSTGQDEKFNFYIDPDEKILSAEQIVKDNSSFIRQYFKFRNMENCTDDEKVLAYKKIQSTEKILHNKTNYYITIPFYNQSRNVIEYLPVNTYSLCYGSNGMCAGNTRDEAIVQGLSEIFERYIQLKIIKERLVVPDIPVDYIKKFPYVYTMYDELTKKSGYSVKLKDCSLGGKYPVAALIVIEKNTGRYGIKFGCHPDYGIAMERAFTEATQGKSIEEYAISGIFDFENLNVATDNNTLNALQIGVAQYPYEFFTCTNEVIFTPVEEVSDKSNKQILINWLDFIKNSGFDVLVRDVSYLGFPSYHVIIPGISEVNNMTDAKFRLLNTRRYINKKLEDVNNISNKDCKYIMALIKNFQSCFGETKIEKYFINHDAKDMPGEDISAGGYYFASLCAAHNAEYDKASYFMRLVVNYAKSSKNNISREKYNFYIATYFYLKGMQVIKDKTKVLNYLSLLFDNYLCNHLKDLFIEEQNIIKKQYGNLATTNSSATAKCKRHYMLTLRNAKLANSIDQNNVFRSM